MIWVFVAIAVGIYGIYLYKTFKKSKQEKIDKKEELTTSECVKVEDKNK